tara:strand:- start:1303 stop:1812 length:510 start_codon:yes stop_codon:yes gene_type:complete
MMKKGLLILLCLPLIFVSCKKEEISISGCKDSSAVNYNYLAELDNGSCIYTKAVIIVKDGSGNPVHQARVILHANQLKQPLFTYDPDNYSSLDALVKANLDTIYSPTGQNSDLFKGDWTDNNGRAEFTLPLEMILNVSVLKIDGNDEYLGANIILLTEGVTVTKIVEIN